jgi:hypothetical protein
LCGGELVILGHYFQISQLDFQKLQNDNHLQDSILKNGDFDNLYDNYYSSGDLWQIIDFLLTDEVLPVSSNPLHKFICGEKQINNYEPLQTIGPFRYFDLDDISEILMLVESINSNNLVGKYDPVLVSQYEIYPHDWLSYDVDEIRDVIRHCYEELREFFMKSKIQKSFIVMFFTT